MNEHHIRLKTSKHKKTETTKNFQDSLHRMLTLIPSPTFTDHLTTWLQPSTENSKDIFLLSFFLNVIQG